VAPFELHVVLVPEQMLLRTSSRPELAGGAAHCHVDVALVTTTITGITGTCEGGREMWKCVSDVITSLGLSLNLRLNI